MIYFKNCNKESSLIRFLHASLALESLAIKNKIYKYSIPTLNSSPFLPPQCQTVSYSSCLSVFHIVLYIHVSINGIKFL